MTSLFTAIMRAEADLADMQRVRYENLRDLLLRNLAMSTRTDDAIAALKADITAQSTVIASASAAFKGLSDQLTAALAAAKDAGATEAQLAELTDLDTAVKANNAGLSAAIPTGTPAEVELGAPGTELPTVTHEETTPAPETTTPTPSEPVVAVEPVTASAGPASGDAGVSATSDETLVTAPFNGAAVAGPAASPDKADDTGASNPVSPAIEEQTTVQTPQHEITIQPTPASAPASNANQG